MKKRFTLSILSVLFLPMTLLAQSAGEAFSADGLSCRMVTSEEGQASIEITGGERAEGTISIPATIEHDGQAFAVTAIAEEAFKGSDLKELNLSGATNLQRIGASAFAECGKLETVNFPSADVSNLTEIGPLAFHHAFSLKQMNLEDTRLEVLESLFSADESDEISIPGLTELKLPKTLKEIKKYALQFLDITEIEIPSSVTTFGDQVLEGCIYLREFTWKNAQITSLPRYTFLGVCDCLERVTLLTVEPLEPTGLTDSHFFMCDKELLQVVLTEASIASLATAGYTNESSVFSTLVAYSGDDDPTAIASPRQTGRQASENAPYYNLQGIRVTNPQPGYLYIRNGRKTGYRQ